METSQKGSRPINGNAPKYYSYKEAWRRMKLAQAQGFFLEVVTIAESVISDRLTSHLAKVEKCIPDNRDHAFSDLIKKWRNWLQTAAVEDSELLAEMIEEVDRWRVRRNHVVHGMVKDNVINRGQSIEDFIAEAEKVAEAGMSLARKVSAWQQKYKRQANQSRKGSLALSLG